MERYKDAKPQDTIASIKSILKSVGLDMQGDVKSLENRLFSVRIIDKSTGFSTNGKGTSEQLCLASAYGEAMERLQSHYGFSRFHDDEVDAYLGFERSPEEIWENFDSVLKNLPFIIDDTLLNYETGDEASARGYWKKKSDDRLCMLPYYQVSTGNTILLPDSLISQMAGSNGLCAGNTPQEALCEGMHELCERYVKAIVLEGEHCLPDIPRDFIEHEYPKQAETIRMIEQTFSGCHIVVKEASLGRGLPVVCIIFIDRTRGRYHIKFGSHFMLEMALERCLTELFQGFDPANMMLVDKALTIWDRTSRKANKTLENCIAMVSSDIGSIPDKIVLSNPDWNFAPWGLEHISNKAGLQILTEKLQAIGSDVFIRDVGFLGFPAYRIYVPGVSARFAVHGPENDRCTFVYSRFSRKLSLAILAFERGDSESAIEYLRSTNCSQHLCAAQELSLKQEGYSEEDRDQLLEQFYGPGIARHVAQCWRSNDVAAALLEQQKKAGEYFAYGPDMKKADSRHKAVATLKRKLKENMTQNPIDQQRIGELYQ